jgi:hypothetical protein
MAFVSAQGPPQPQPIDRQLTRRLGGSSAGARPTARDTPQLCHNEFSRLEETTGRWTSPDDFAQCDNTQRIPSSLVARNVRQREGALTNTPPSPIVLNVRNTHSFGLVQAVAVSSRGPTQRLPGRKLRTSYRDREGDSGCPQGRRILPW